ncbi:MAG: glyoxalase [Anaerolineae bacterium]|nr:MAG: glyoxalase [Anaerolineae bacterium]
MFLTARDKPIDRQSRPGPQRGVLRPHCAPSLDVPGMTEFRLSAACVLGLMPEAGIKRLLGSRLPDPAQAAGIRAELYLRVANALEYHRRALEAGAIELSEPRDRDWGDRVAYAGPDGHVLAFAEKQVANLADTGPE